MPYSDSSVEPWYFRSPYSIYAGNRKDWIDSVIEFRLRTHGENSDLNFVSDVLIVSHIIQKEAFCSIKEISGKNPILGEWTLFSVAVNEPKNWKIRSTNKDRSSNGKDATTNDIKKILKSLTSIEIRGEWIIGGSCDLDNFSICPPGYKPPEVDPNCESNLRPETVGSIGIKKVPIGKEGKLELKEYFQDPEGDILTYDVIPSDGKIPRKIKFDSEKGSISSLFGRKNTIDFQVRAFDGCNYSEYQYLRFLSVDQDEDPSPEINIIEEDSSSNDSSQLGKVIGIGVSSCLVAFITGFVFFRWFRGKNTHTP